jgi:DNA-binding transcriptional regulator YhcF (GntR family)
MMNPNTVVRAYLELKHGSGAFIKESASGRARLIHKAQAVVQSTVERLLAMGLTEDELRRAFENELSQTRATRGSRAITDGKL